MWESLNKSACKESKSQNHLNFAHAYVHMAVCQKVSVMEIRPAISKNHKHWNLRKVLFLVEIVVKGQKFRHCFLAEWQISDILRRKQKFEKHSNLLSNYINKWKIFSNFVSFYILNYTNVWSYAHDKFLGLIRDIHKECSKQFKWNLYFYGSGQSRPF